MITSRNGYDLIKESEGLRLKSYQDSVGVWTIGYGHTFGVVVAQTITESIAEEFLKNDVRECEIDLNKLGLTLNQNQFDAIIDFLFNLGITKFKKSTIYKKMQVNINDPDIANEINKWVYGKKDGKAFKLPGLITRRAKEVKLYFDKNL